MKRTRPFHHARLVWIAAALSVILHALFWIPAVRSRYLLFLLVYALLFVLYLIGAHGMRRWGATTFWLVFVFAVLFRLIHLGYTPFLSTDINRYVWDGKVQHRGINPFRYSPDSQNLESLRDGSWEDINFKSMPTIYPPLAQALFFTAYTAGKGTLAFRILFLLFDLGLILLLWRICRAVRAPPEMVVIYAWNPLPILEFCGSGHLDAVAIFFFWAALYALIIGREYWASFWLALSILTKFIGLFAGLLIWRRLRRKSAMLLVPLIAVLAYLPYLGARGQVLGNLWAYVGQWRFNASLFYLVEQIVQHDVTARGIVFGAFAVLVGLVAWKETSLIRGLAVSFLAFLCLMPTVHPWYMIWLLPFACFVRLRSALWITFMGGVIYFGTLGGFSGEDFRQSGVLLVIEYLGFYTLVVLDLIHLYGKGSAVPRSGRKWPAIPDESVS